MASKRKVVMTGFGKFNGVEDNPTTHIIKHFEKLEDKPDLLHIFHVSKEKGGEELCDLQCKVEEDCEQIWIHLGVYAGSDCFHLEQTGHNDLTFRAPDECGLEICEGKICEDQEFGCQLKTDFDLKSVCDELRESGFNVQLSFFISIESLHIYPLEFEVELSDDPGRFICNFVYYKSLQHCQGKNRKCVFVHVPAFDKISFEEQCKFVHVLIEKLVAHF